MGLKSVLSFVTVCLFIVSGSTDMLFPELSSDLWGSDNPQCAKDSMMFQEGLGNMSLWAYGMWESSARDQIGALRGSTHQLGNFDECMLVPSPFRTQYCLVELHMNVPAPKDHREIYDVNYDPNDSVFEKLYYTGDKARIPRNVLVMGLCTPASCSNTDIQKELNDHIHEEGMNKNKWNLTYDVKVISETCQTDRAEEGFDAADMTFCVIMLLAFVSVFICTIFDLRQRNEYKAKVQEKSFSSKLVSCFSASKNFNELSRSDDSNSALNILYGMRTIAIFMIIIDHRFGTYITGPIINREYVEQQYRTFVSLFIYHGDLFVDSFFVLSGLLVTYNLMIAFEKKTSPLLIILNRYIRLTPVFAIVVFFYATLLYKTGSGPMWKLIVGGMQSDCKQNWWAALLYVGNYVNDANMCMVHSWFLPCDFHYFILAIPTIFLLKRRPMTAIALLFVAFIISILIPFGITMYYERPGLLNFYIDFLSAPKVHPDFRMTYTKSHTRASSYIIGMFTGYAYYKLRNSTIKLSFIRSNVLTIIGLLLMFAGMASGGVFYDPYHPYKPLEAALYAGLHRPAWALGSAILLINASYGRMSVMRTVLEWKPWIPLSKLVYGAYLVHMCWQLRSTAMVLAPRYASLFGIFTLGLGDIVLSFGLALVLNLLIEAPTRKFFRLLMTPKPRSNDPKPEVILQETTVININTATENSQI